MGDSDVPLTAEDLAAAREAMRLHPVLPEGTRLEDLERGLAELHRRWGDDRFRLNLGLREPANDAEKCKKDFHVGKISFDEMRSRLRAYAARPVDAQMLRAFFLEVGQQVHRYDQFMHEAEIAYEHPSRHWSRDSEDTLTRLANAIQGKFALYKQEIQSCLEFLEEARIAKQAGTVRMEQESTSTVAEMVDRISHRVKKAWTNDRALSRSSQIPVTEYSRPIPAIIIFGQVMFPWLPSAHDLQLLVDQEYALARIYLRECRVSNDPAKPDVPLAVDAEVPPPEVKQHLLTVAHWSDLAIGVDEERRFWAISPVPADGAIFSKSKAMELNLRGDRWKAVLELSAASDTGDVVKRADLLARLGYFVPGTSVERDGRAKPGAIEAANVEELRVRQSAALFRLKNTLSDLRRELLEQIEGPTNRGAICLRTDRDVVRSGFVVRFLVRDESEILRFGQRK